MYILIFILFVILITLLVCLLYKPKKDKIPENYNPQSPQNHNKYSKYNYSCNAPRGYHRYQSNLCDPTQDELPITFPNPNLDLPIDMSCVATQKDRIINNLKYGSESCGCNQVLQ
jgi:hypothetical protein